MQISNVAVQRDSIAAATSNAGAATETGDAVQLSDLWQPSVFVELTNGATAPTAAANAAVQIKILNSDNWLTIKNIAGSGDNDGVAVDFFALPPCQQVRVVVDGNDDQAVTVQASVFAFAR